MKAAIGNTLLMGIIVTFLSVVLLILISSIAYTKAFRVKNRIIDEIEKVEIYDSNVDNALNTIFREIGYKANSLMNNSSCDNYEPEDGELLNSTSAYHYCIFKMNSSKQNGYYYKVVAFAYLDFPLINAIQIPVYGETKIFYNTSDA